MQTWAKKIYLSRRWRALRDFIISRDNGLCVRCGKIGTIVHHIVWLTPDNCNDTVIVFGADNLELLCDSCHNAIHEGKTALADGLAFDDQGNVVSVAARR